MSCEKDGEDLFDKEVEDIEKEEKRDVLLEKCGLLQLQHEERDTEMEYEETRLQQVDSQEDRDLSKLSLRDEGEDTEMEHKGAEQEEEDLEEEQEGGRDLSNLSLREEEDIEITGGSRTSSSQ